MCAFASFVVFIVGDYIGIWGSLSRNFVCLHPPHLFYLFIYLDVGNVFVSTSLDVNSKCSSCLKHQL